MRYIQFIKEKQLSKNINYFPCLMIVVIMDMYFFCKNIKALKPTFESKAKITKFPLNPSIGAKDILRISL